MKNYSLVVSTCNSDHYIHVADDRRIRTVRGFVDQFQAALGISKFSDMKRLYTYAEVQMSYGDPDEYKVIDSISFTGGKGK